MSERAKFEVTASEAATYIGISLFRHRNEFMEVWHESTDRYSHDYSARRLRRHLQQRRHGDEFQCRWQ